MKSRSDEWTSQEDQLLAETILKNIQAGKTQLFGFTEASTTQLPDRTYAACGFRWNAVLRKKYVSQIREAKQVGRLARYSIPAPIDELNRIIRDYIQLSVRFHELQMKDVAEMQAIYEAAAQGLEASKACGVILNGNFNLTPLVAEGVGK